MYNGFVTSEENRRRDALHASLRWAWTVLFQCDRIDQTQNQLAREARIRDRNFDQPEREKHFRLDADRHFLFVAGRQLARALSMLAFGTQPPASIAAVTTIRNCFEHWDEKEGALAVTNPKDPRGRAYRKFKAKHPDSEPEAHSWGAGGTLIGGVDVNGLQEDVRRIFDDLIRLEESGWVWTGRLPGDTEDPP